MEMEVEISLQEQVIEVLQSIYDPEIPVNIYELGLIYGVHVSEENLVSIKMTLTSPNCPAAQSLPQEVEMKVKRLPGVTGCTIEIVWEPTWGKEMMSEAARLQLGL